MATTDSSGQPQSAELLSQAYGLLAAVLKADAADDGFACALTRLLRETETSEYPPASPLWLPLLACEAAGGDAEQALPVAVAWRGLHIASKLLDDVEDGDASCIGAIALPVNLSTGFYAASMLCLSRLPADVSTDLMPLFHRTILRMAGGQHRELTRGEGDSVESCVQTIGDKAGSFFALAAYAGTRCASRDTSVLDSLWDFGFGAGVMLQMMDDLAGLHQSGPTGDLANGRRKLPVIYALSVASPGERARLEQLLEEATGDPGAESGLRDALAALGSQVYMAAEIARYRRRALASLERVASAEQRLDPLRAWLSCIGQFGPREASTRHARADGR